MSGTEWHHEPPLSEGFVPDDETTLNQQRLLRDAEWLARNGVIHGLTVRGFVFGLRFEFSTTGAPKRRDYDEVEFRAFVEGVRAAQAADWPTRH